jgi:hypothetical protein
VGGLVDPLTATVTKYSVAMDALHSLKKKAVDEGLEPAPITGSESRRGRAHSKLLHARRCEMQASGGVAGAAAGAAAISARSPMAAVVSRGTCLLALPASVLTLRVKMPPKASGVAAKGHASTPVGAVSGGGDGVSVPENDWAGHSAKSLTFKQPTCRFISKGGESESSSFSSSS